MDERSRLSHENIKHSEENSEIEDEYSGDVYEEISGNETDRYADRWVSHHYYYCTSNCNGHNGDILKKGYDEFVEKLNLTIESSTCDSAEPITVKDKIIMRIL